MSLSPRDAERARQFQANRSQTRQLRQGNTLLELTQVQAAIRHYQTKLIAVLDAHDEVGAKQIVQQLISLRATQCALAIRHQQEIGSLNQTTVTAERTAYLADCARLIAAIV